MLQLYHSVGTDPSHPHVATTGQSPASWVVILALCSDLRHPHCDLGLLRMMHDFSTACTSPCGTGHCCMHNLVPCMFLYVPCVGVTMAYTARYARSAGLLPAFVLFPIQAVSQPVILSARIGKLCI